MYIQFVWIMDYGNTKYELWNLYKIQNIWFVVLFFFLIRFVFRTSRTNEFVRNVFWCFGCILYYKLIFWIWYSDFVSFSVYMKLKKCDLLKRCPRSVNSFRTKYFGGYFGGSFRPKYHDATRRYSISARPNQ